MKYAIFGDVHSNFEAFLQVIKHAQKSKVEKYICTGDLIGYGPNPLACLGLLKQLPLEVYIGGNHEAALFQTNNNMNPIAKAGLEHTKAQLSDEDKNYIYNKAFWNYEIKEGVMVTHASLAGDGEYFPYVSVFNQDRDQCYKIMKENNVDVLFVGHSHTPALLSPNIDKTMSLMTERKLDNINLKKYMPCIVDIGSVGQPRDGNPKASYVIYDSDEDSIERYRLEYDFEKTIDKINDVGLPSKLGTRLRKGK